jgi:hypothetical protein
MSALMANLQALGIELPTPAYIAGVLVFSVIGIFAYYRGKARGLPRMRWSGLALMLYPYVVSSTGLMYAVGVGLVVLAFANRS